MSTLAHVALEDSWKQALAPVLLSDRMQALRAFLLAQKQAGKTLYPPSADIFAAFNHTPLNRVKVVILGQDPYHGAGQAHGLAFSVNQGLPLPPSLRNIYKELAADTGLTPPAHGDLSHWAAQGVLLLNSVLTVEAGQPGSHQKQGWEELSDAAIQAVSQHNNGCVFILWGAYAQRKGQCIDANKHLILSASHPSPLSANRGGFFGSKPFTTTNAYLISQGHTPIAWV